MGAVDSNLLVEDKTLVKVRVGKLSALLLDDLDVLEVRGTLDSRKRCQLRISSRAPHQGSVAHLQPQHSINGKGRKVILVRSENLAAKGSASDGEEVFAERDRVLAVVLGGSLQSGKGDTGCDTETFDNTVVGKRASTSQLSMKSEGCCGSRRTFGGGRGRG